ncbi:hypothetical protein M885DRAFT_511386, partial [Pelagophyceae sp. CCMP2097]
MALCAASAGGGADAASAIAAARRLVRTDAVAKAGGSATALVVRVSRGSDAVELANFGDCAAALLRPTPRRFKMPKNAMVLWPRVVVRTAEQTHFFNCPYQVAAEDADEDDSELGGATVDSLSAQAKPGDIIVVASDGVWDNLDDDHIQRLVAEKVATLWASAGRHGAMFPEKELATISDDALAFETPSAVLAFLAETIAAEAIKVGASNDRTPFERTAQQEGIKGLQGGKADDVTVVVLLIVSDEAKFTADDESMMHNFAEFASVDHAAVAADAAYDAEIL